MKSKLLIALAIGVMAQSSLQAILSPKTITSIQGLGRNGAGVRSCYKTKRPASLPPHKCYTGLLPSTFEDIQALQLIKRLKQENAQLKAQLAATTAVAAEATVAAEEATQQAEAVTEAAQEAVAELAAEEVAPEIDVENGENNE